MMEIEQETNRGRKRNMHLVIKTYNLRLFTSPVAAISYMLKAINDLLFSLKRRGLSIRLNYSNTNLCFSVFFIS